MVRAEQSFQAEIGQDSARLIESVRVRLAFVSVNLCVAVVIVSGRFRVVGDKEIIQKRRSGNIGVVILRQSSANRKQSGTPVGFSTESACLQRTGSGVILSVLREVCNATTVGIFELSATSHA
jgi:hypothetical protein